MATASASLYKGSDDLDLTCDVCQHQNKTSIAVSYCETCEEALCQTCDNVHRSQKLTRAHSLLIGDRLIDIKLIKQCRDFGNVQATSHVDDSVPGRTQSTIGQSRNTLGHYKRTSGQGGRGPGRKPGISRPSGSAHIKATSASSGSGASLMPGTSSDYDSVPGRVNYSDRDTDTVPSVLGLTVSDIKYHNVGCHEVRSVVFMPSGHVVLACYKDGLKLLDKHFKQLSQLSLFSVCACKVSATEVLVSQGFKKQIRFVDVLPKMVGRRVLTIGKVSTGVCYHNGEIYAACGDYLGRSEVRVMKKDGTVIRRLGVHGRKYVFTWPCDVKVNNAGDKVFVSDHKYGDYYDMYSVTCMNKVGRVIYKYTDFTKFERPTGILVDIQDNVLVTTGSKNVHVINNEGITHTILLSQKDIVGMPWCISYRQDDGLLAVGIEGRGRKRAFMTVKTSLA